MKIKNAVVAGALALGLGNAQAELFDRGGGLIYDSDQNVTWLQDANYAKTSGNDADGLMNWGSATAWATNLVVHDSVRNADYSDWRLPTAVPCTGYSCIGSEMGHLFYIELGNSAGALTNTGSFLNVQADWYWSGTDGAPYSRQSGGPGDSESPYYGRGLVWIYHTNTGYQYSGRQTTEYYAMVVRDGDVAAPIPEPETYALMLAGLGLLSVCARCRKQQQA